VSDATDFRGEFKPRRKALPTNLRNAGLLFGCARIFRRAWVSRRARILPRAWVRARFRILFLHFYLGCAGILGGTRICSLGMRHRYGQHQGDGTEDKSEMLRLHFHGDSLFE
jgi:hypothetical protein